MDKTAGNKDQQPLARKAGLRPARRACVSAALTLTIGGASIGLLSLRPRIPALVWNASSITGRIVDRGLAIPPTIRVQAGARIAIIVTRRSTF